MTLDTELDLLSKASGRRHVMRKKKKNAQGCATRLDSDQPSQLKKLAKVLKFYMTGSGSG